MNSATAIRRLISGAHVLIYSNNPEADRAFFRDVLGFRCVDVGHGWLIFALPPAEMALHPAAEGDLKRHSDHQLLGAVVYLMCEDLKAVVRALAAKNVHCTGVTREPWGERTTIPLPSGGEIGLYQPSHQTALGLDARD